MSHSPHINMVDALSVGTHDQPVSQARNTFVVHPAMGPSEFVLDTAVNTHGHEDSDRFIAETDRLDQMEAAMAC